MGKTAFMLNIAQHAAIEAQVPVAFFSLEMSKESLVQRMLTAEARIDAQRLRKGMLRDDDFPRLARAAGILSSAPIWIDDTPGITLLEMRSKARRLKADNDSAWSSWTTCSSCRGRRTRRTGSRRSARSRARSRRWRRSCSVPVIALSQLSRAPEQRTGEHKRPQLSDLRESGAIEQDADLVMFLYRQEIYDGPSGRTDGEDSARRAWPR